MDHHVMPWHGYAAVGNKRQQSQLQQATILHDLDACRSADPIT